VKAPQPKMFGLSFGAMSPTIKSQLDAAGLSASPAELKHWQTDAEAVVRLACRGLLSDSEKSKACGRLMKKIAKRVFAKEARCSQPKP